MYFFRILRRDEYVLKYIVYCFLADVYRTKSEMDVLLASLQLETSFRVSGFSGYMTRERTRMPPWFFRVHRDILEALGSVIGDVKRIGKEKN